MKLVIQIPCFNEEPVIRETLAALPRRVDGFHEVEWLIVDDGSADGTVQAAREAGADHVHRLGAHRGLATAFSSGLRAALDLGADVIVNFDADLQYRPDDIPALVLPILEGRAEIVIAERRDPYRFESSLTKRLLSRIGNRIVCWVSGLEINDAPSGFRAMSREAAARINIFSRYSYTLEMVIQAGRLGIPVAMIPVEINPPRRPSRLMRSIPHYVLRSGLTVIRIGLIYKPAFTLGVIGCFLLFGAACFFGLDRLGYGTRSFLIGMTLVILGSQSLVTGILANLVAVNRRLLEELVARQRRSHEK